MNSPELTLSISGLSVCISNRRILDKLDLDLYSGEFISLIGSNGAGKSTLLRTLIRLMKPEEGQILLLGRPIDSFEQRDIGRIIAYVPQNYVANPPFTVIQTLISSRYSHFKESGGPCADDYEVIEQLMNEMNLTGLEDRMMGTLSGGERQKVMVAAAMAQEPQILLLDELTTYLDPRHQSEIMNIMIKLTENHNVTILSATHELNHAALLSDRMVALKDGRTLWDLSPKKAMNSISLDAVFGGGIKLIQPASSDNDDLPIAIPSLKRMERKNPSNAGSANAGSSKAKLSRAELSRAEQ